MKTDLSDLTPAEQSVFHGIRTRVAKFNIRLLDEAARRGKLPSGRERLHRSFAAIASTGFGAKRLPK